MDYTNARCQLQGKVWGECCEELGLGVWNSLYSLFFCKSETALKNEVYLLFIKPNNIQNNKIGSSKYHILFIMPICKQNYKTCK